MLARPAVRVVPFQPHCFAFGGFEVQMLAAMESARAAGANVEPLDFWRREAEFDVLHLWGLDLQHSNTVKWTHAAGKKIVLSALVSYPGLKSSLRYLASLAVGPARLRKPMLAMIDCLTVVNKEQARYLVETVKLPAEKVTVIPNLVDDIFFETGSYKETGEFGIDNYVLCTGNICRRKNQLALVSACRKLGVPLLLVGDVLTGEEDYGQTVTEAIAPYQAARWVKGLKPGSVKLASAYKRAVAFALPSFLEQQPISALEAAAAGKPLLLADRPYAKQEFYTGAGLVDPNSVGAIADALRNILDQPDAHCPPRSVIEQCRKEKVGAAYAAVYQRLANGRA